MAERGITRSNGWRGMIVTERLDDDLTLRAVAHGLLPAWFLMEQRLLTAREVADQLGVSLQRCCDGLAKEFCSDSDCRVERCGIARMTEMHG